MRFSGFALAATLAVVPFTGRAQDAAPQLQEDPRAPRFREVERGVFAGFEVGWMRLFDTKVADSTRYSFASNGGGAADGILLGVHAGFDIGKRLALSAFALGSNQKADPSYGAFDVIAAGGDLRVALIGMRDGDGTERVYLYLHARAGWMKSHPDGLFGSSDILAAGGPGIEYYTRLRHFSLGLALDGVYVVDAGTAGFSVTPTLRYSF